MKKTWKQILTMGCAVALLTAMPGVTVLADEMQAGTVMSVTDDVDEIIDVAKGPDTEQLHEDDPTEDVLEEYAADVEPEVVEEGIDDSGDAEITVGAEEIFTVGDGVTATFDKTTGAVKLYSNAGELWRDWLNESELDAKNIKSIKVASGTVYLPDDSSYIFSVSYYDREEGCSASNLNELDLSRFDTSNVTDMEAMFYGCSSLISLD